MRDAVLDGMPRRRDKRKDKVVPEFSGHCSVCFSPVRTRDSVLGNGAVHHLACWLVRRLVSTRPAAPRAA
jgi:hypothetical protein